ncbi:D-2-hydroxyacid dehydrogenase [Ligilactobacillus equi]
MKVIMYGVSDDERRHVQAWQDQHQDEIKLVTEPLTKETIALAAGFDGVSTKQVESLDEEVYQQLSAFGIKHLALRIVGYNIVDFDKAHAHGITTVSNVPAYSPRAIAENGLAVALNLLRKISVLQDRERRGDFTLPESLMSEEIYTKTVGVIGVGNIGSASAQLYSALGARVLGYDPIYRANYEPYLTYTDLETVLKEADIITIHTPLDDSTREMLGAKEFALMKPGTIFINQARGGLVDTEAMIAALESGHLGGVGLDVLSSESEFFWKVIEDPAQLPADYQRLAKMPNAIVTPHSAYYTQTAVRNMVMQSLEDIRRFLDGQKPLYVVDL